MKLEWWQILVIVLGSFGLGIGICYMAIVIYFATHWPESG